MLTLFTVLFVSFPLFFRCDDMVTFAQTLDWPLIPDATAVIWHRCNVYQFVICASVTDWIGVRSKPFPKNVTTNVTYQHKTKLQDEIVKTNLSCKISTQYECVQNAGTLHPARQCSDRQTEQTDAQPDRRDIRTDTSNHNTSSAWKARG